ncbi:MAG: beta-ketoacyl-[acyl-carrier-protein] synthase family protein [Bacteroidales bacterium]|nr:beta-ketoacyl-[acyl-carrier-protein] synthase family protein [Bacteroidales bacterium]
MVVISGMGIVSALGIGLQDNLQSLEAERVGLRKIQNFATIHDVPAGELPLDNRELKRRLGINEAKVVSRTSLLGMLAAEEALADAGVGDRSRVALITATTVGGMDLTPVFFADFMADRTKGRLRYVRQHDCSNSTNAIADYCHIDGFTTAISTACSSAANAIMTGCRLIEQGLADCVVAGGTDALCVYTLNGFKSLMILDSDRCRPFDANRKGLNLGEAAAYVVLQRATDAHKQYCAVAGYANANDAFHQTAMTAEGQGASEAMLGALRQANLQPADIDYINAHGTGTPNNDASELAAMQSVWADKMPKYSSTKGFTGHTLAAAGSVEAVFAALAIEHQTVWANIGCETPISQQFAPVAHTAKCAVRNVMSNSFGFGGNCTSLVFSKI